MKGEEPEGGSAEHTRARHVCVCACECACKSGYRDTSSSAPPNGFHCGVLLHTGPETTKTANHGLKPSARIKLYSQHCHELGTKLSSMDI